MPWIKSHYHFYSQLVAVLRPFTHFAICLFSAPLTSLSLAAPTHDDPCVKIAGQAIVDLAEALTCLKSFPLTFNETLRQNVLSMVSGVFDIYTFEDFYLNSLAPFQESTTDIRAQINLTDSTRYEVRVFPIPSKGILAHGLIPYETDYDSNQDPFDSTRDE